MKPMIALTYTNNPLKHDNYVRWMMESADVQIVTIGVEHSPLEVLEQCDGLIMSGGIDVHPSFYGMKKKDYPNAPDKFDKRRDELESAAFIKAQQREMPVLAICRGMQLVNCLLKGKMKQDLGSKANAIHKSEKAVDKAHGIMVLEDTLLHNVLGGRRFAVNSAHHQCVQKAGKGLRICAVSDDGVAEAIEWEQSFQRPFFLGVQWHPERLFALNLNEYCTSIAIRERFIKEVMLFKASYENL